ncbi:MAG: serine/threonine protein kinase, partial [Gemmataceae bacterium]
MVQPIQTSSLLVGELQKLELLSPEQLNTLQANGFTARHADGRGAARELLQRGWLTPFQVNQLLQGRGTELIQGSYLLLERLGDGGAGQVFKARHLHMQRVIALKILHKDLLDDQETLDRFRREVRLISELNHPNVVQAHDAVLTGNTYYMAMEYVEGVDLGGLVKQRGALPVSQACEYIRQACLGLQYIHDRGLVHRDIKPSNLLVTGKPVPTSPPWGLLKILDLGLARPQRSIDPDGGITKTSSFTIGTVDYMSPEQANDFRGVDIRSDIYSLGCTAYVLLAGRPPFEGTMAQKLVRHQQAEPPPIERLRIDVPQGVAMILR